MLLNLAKENKENKENISSKVKKFFTANETNKQTEFIRTDLNLNNEETEPVMLLVNLKDMIYYRYNDEQKVTIDN